MDRNEERRERLRRHEGDRPTGDYTESRDSMDPRTETNRTNSGNSSGTSGEKGTIDKLIDKAQEKGYFDKAEKFVRDKFGGGSGGGSGSSRGRR